MKKGRYITAVIIALAILVMITHVYVTSYHARMKSNEVVYVYDTLRGVPNPAFYSDWEDFGNWIIEYYKKKEKDTSTVVYLMDTRVLPPNDPVYLVGYTSEDSVMAEVYIDYRIPRQLAQGSTVYVYAKCIHKISPKEWVLKKKQ
ncbi:hypothetical protein [Persicobacter psychrovividus]|uniref:Uncharacterized protein n=1 Tax=Persicobacter psychrovividus TaxID=387638 RepID=A0ABM7VE54_9BACT|nr:hypothetical protein PEPS_15210 [Persicobacter psychrovividus]